MENTENLIEMPISNQGFSNNGWKLLKKFRNNKNNYYALIKCEKCGQTIYRQKKSKLITHTNNYRCKCGGKLNITMKKEI